MIKVSVADAKSRFGALLKETHSGPVVVMRNGRPIAALVAVNDQVELDRVVFASSHRLQKILEAGRTEIREGRGIPAEEFWKQVEAEQPQQKKKKRPSER